MARSGEHSVLRPSPTAWCKERNHRRCKEVGLPCSCACHDDEDEPEGDDEPEQVEEVEPEVPEAPAPLSVVSDAGIVWGAPPRWRHGPPRAVPDAKLAELRAAPGEWGMVKHYLGKSSGATAAARIKDGGGSYGPGWEATSRLAPGGGSDLYMRWVGDAPP